MKRKILGMTIGLVGLVAQFIPVKASAEATCCLVWHGIDFGCITCPDSCKVETTDDYAKAWCT